MVLPLVIIGGIGGGGDIGLALVLKDYLNLIPASVLSFLNCPSKKLPVPGKKAYKGLWIPSVEHPRLFEAKLNVMEPNLSVFAICTREHWNVVKRGLDYFMKLFDPKITLHTDLGGDAIVLGYESNFGSYKTDALGRAALHYLSTEYGVRVYLAVGNVGAEAWKLHELVAILKYLKEEGVFVGSILPSKESLVKAKLLASLGCSGMLPLYLNAVEGKKVVEERLCYLKPPIKIKPWYKYSLIFDLKELCELSPLCMKARREWIGGLKGWKSLEPPAKLKELLKYYEDMGETDIENEILKIIESEALSTSIFED
ncbi:hypothetical protein IPA_02805 [Ignicoccus pacificus DSM 13166]|uniref:DUF1152 domain-containing protein n=1 Tax=Ignicoccus pacificus DSM 13166 TaxID=940294 RepID=A0A977KAU4_9CREN|nr:hypothetical protein IPA_02805 [Ignicoccus pacificus DSM 13166]